MQDETPQEQAAPQDEKIETTQGTEHVERVTANEILDAAAILGPPLGAAAAWGLAKLDAHNEQKPEPPEIILPPGVEEK